MGGSQAGLPPTAGSDAGSPLAERLNSEMRKVVPREPGKNWVFDGYIDPRTREVAWSRSWTSKLDFTGVAWDETKNLTMITPRHALMAKHYVRKLGSLVTFHDRDGREVTRVLVSVARVPGADVAIGILNEPVPAGIKKYKLLEPSETLHPDLQGTLALVTDAERKVHVHEIGSVIPNMLMFRRAKSLPDGFYEPLIRGDSGNPSFVLVRGELVLVETHHHGGAGAGPFYGSAKIQDEIRAAIQRLAVANGGGEYSFATIKP